MLEKFYKCLHRLRGILFSLHFLRKWILTGDHLISPRHVVYKMRRNCIFGSEKRSNDSVNFKDGAILDKSCRLIAVCIIILVPWITFYDRIFFTFAFIDLPPPCLYSASVLFYTVRNDKNVHGTLLRSMTSFYRKLRII